MSLDAYLQEIVRNLASAKADTEIARGKLIEIALLHLGVISPLLRADF